MILVINIGSSSKKYALFERDTAVFSAHFERDGGGFLARFGDAPSAPSDEVAFRNGLQLFLEALARERGIGVAQVASAGVRVVASGSYFAEHRPITDSFLDALAAVAASDPVHIDPILEEIRTARTLLSAIPLYAISDSAFHRTQHEIARRYALPRSLEERSDVYRYGFHGLSVASVARTFKDRIAPLPPRVIVCHLGSGSSVTALENGISVDTSMGYAPLSGLIMSSRIGDIDAGAMFKLLEKHSPAELQKLFYAESGLKAISGISSDMRALLDAETAGHEGARRAIAAFVRSMQKYIGAYAAVLQGVDALIFSGMMGERSAPIRARVCADLGWIGIALDQTQNEASVMLAPISTGSVGVYVVPSDEASQIAHETSLLLA